METDLLDIKRRLKNAEDALLAKDGLECSIRRRADEVIVDCNAAALIDIARRIVDIVATNAPFGHVTIDEGDIATTADGSLTIVLAVPQDDDDDRIR